MIYRTSADSITHVMLGEPYEVSFGGKWVDVYETLLTDEGYEKGACLYTILQKHVDSLVVNSRANRHLRGK